MPLDDMLPALSGHEDGRRKIIDVSPKVKHYVIKNKMGVRLGDHYLTESGALFYVMKGRLRYKVEDILSKERSEGILDRREELHLSPYQAIILFPQPKSEFLVIYRVPHDEVKIHPYEITW